jgi:Dyp-type peroxidase family
MPISEELLDVTEIQGNILRGFGTKYLQLIGLQIADGKARNWIASLAGKVDTLADTHRYRLQRSAAPETIASSVQINAGLSARALEKLGLSTDNVNDGFFLSPMGDLAASLGDEMVGGKPANYCLGSNWNDTPDILLLLGGEDPGAVAETQAALVAEAQAAGLMLSYHETGEKNPGEVEHFGFRDGISQPGPRGRLSAREGDFLTQRYLDASDPFVDRYARPGQPLIWPGQFVFGYGTQLPHDPMTPGAVSTGGAPWMKNGSFFVFRRLLQKVDRFRSFASEFAAALTEKLGRPISSDWAAAQLVGRWPDGTPLAASPFGPDRSIAADDMRVNFFAYANGPSQLTISMEGAVRTVSGASDDSKGLACPFYSHIRKVNPRGLPTDQDIIPDRTLTFQMLRRGIPFGPRFEPGKNDDSERGLFFLAYMTSIDRQFARLNRIWINNPGAPELYDEGFDMLIGQAPDRQRFLVVRDEHGTEIMRQHAAEKWVVPTGGAFMFSPSVSFLANLALVA